MAINKDAMYTLFYGFGRPWVFSMTWSNSTYGGLIEAAFSMSIVDDVAVVRMEVASSALVNALIG